MGDDDDDGDDGGMSRLRRVSRLWAWLPAFRAVGETEHIRQAAEVLHISPSALSRTVGLVEADVESELFQRVGRRISLTPAGSALLDATRDAMRIVHHALARIDSGIMTGEIRIAAPGTISRMFVLPAMHKLRETHPDLRPALANPPENSLADLLLRGDLDVALTIDPVIEQSLTSAAIGRYTNGIYCGVGHPLFDTDDVSVEQLLEFAFVAPPLDDRGRAPEGWPVELARDVDIRASDLQIGVEICLGGKHLAVLPDLIAKPDADRGALRRLDVELIPATPFFATHRRTLGKRGAAELIVDAVLAVVAST